MRILLFILNDTHLDDIKIMYKCYVFLLKLSITEEIVKIICIYYFVLLYYETIYYYFYAIGTHVDIIYDNIALYQYLINFYRTNI